MKKLIISQYLDNVLTAEGMRAKVSRVVQKLKHYTNEFDAIAFRGISGALIAPAVALSLGKDVIVVRKDESRHSTLRVEGVRCERYIIVDDFVENGDTISAIRNRISVSDCKSRLVGVVLYNHPQLKQSDLKKFADMYKAWFYSVSKPAPVRPTTEIKKMRKKEILKHYPKKNDYKKEADSKRKLSKKLAEDAERATQIYAALKNISLHNDFPVRLSECSGGMEILSGCDEVKRSAYVKLSTEGKHYLVTTYKNNGDEMDGTPVEGEFAKTAALKIAKEYVATGHKPSLTEKAPARG